MELKPGARLRSAVCSTEVVVVRAAPVELRCGGRPMVLADGAGRGDAVRDEARAEGTLLGKRYADPESGLEVLCTKAGPGPLTLGDAPLRVKDARSLPSSD
jgi:hypothetical protein